MVITIQSKSLLTINRKENTIKADSTFYKLGIVIPTWNKFMAIGSKSN